MKLNSLANNRGWVLGHDDGGYDRALALHDDRFGGIAAPNGGTYRSKLGMPPLHTWMHVVATLMH